MASLGVAVLDRGSVYSQTAPIRWQGAHEGRPGSHFALRRRQRLHALIVKQGGSRFMAALMVAGTVGAGPAWLCVWL